MLWIAFRLYLWGIGDTPWLVISCKSIVVNCFQIVSLRYWWHHNGQTIDCVVVVNCFQIVSLRYWWHRGWISDANRVCCELLSDCIFEVLVTPKTCLLPSRPLLWIAFRLYLWGIGDTSKNRTKKNKYVVNCFQIVSLRYWWHLDKQKCR